MSFQRSTVGSKPSVTATKRFHRNQPPMTDPHRMRPMVGYSRRFIGKRKTCPKTCAFHLRRKTQLTPHLMTLNSQSKRKKKRENNLSPSPQPRKTKHFDHKLPTRSSPPAPNAQAEKQDTETAAFHLSPASVEDLARESAQGQGDDLDE
eukprot:1393488-Amorphochlora_amoeboformis.AAC.1